MLTASMATPAARCALCAISRIEDPISSAAPATLATLLLTCSAALEALSARRVASWADAAICSDVADRLAAEDARPAAVPATLPTSDCTPLTNRSNSPARPPISSSRWNASRRVRSPSPSAISAMRPRNTSSGRRTSCRSHRPRVSRTSSSPTSRQMVAAITSPRAALTALAVTAPARMWCSDASAFDKAIRLTAPTVTKPPTAVAAALCTSFISASRSRTPVRPGRL
jgi:hypothetical protein